MNKQTTNRLLACLVSGLVSAGSSWAQAPSVTDHESTPATVDILFSSSATQAGLQGFGDLGALAQQNSALGESASAFGFSAKSDEANVFLAGALNAEVLAFLSSGDLESAADRLEALQDQCIRLGTPGSLYAFVSKMLNLVQREAYSTDALLDMFSLYQPFFEDYARSRPNDDYLILFRAGSWLVDLSLAAAVGQTDMLRQPAHLDYLMREMERMDAPKGVGDALDEIATVSEKEKISARDSQTVVEQVKRIQILLG